MSNNTKLETNDSWRTGSECPDSASYCCKMHSSFEKYIHEGENFPKCDQKGMPHNTIWHKLIY